MRLKVLLSVLLVCLGLVARSGQSDFYVMKVYSGDRIRVIDIDGKQFDVRLRGIDAPELDQVCGKESMKYLMQMLQKKKFVHFEDARFFKDGNAEATIYLHLQWSDSNMNKAMVESGMAWDVTKDGRYAYEQNEAKEKRLGLWGFFPQIKPSEWRKSHPCELASIGAAEASKLIPPQSAWDQFLKQEKRRAERIEAEKEASARFEEEHKVENELRQFPYSVFEGWNELSIKSLFGVELGTDFKSIPFEIKRLDNMEALRVYGFASDSYTFTPKKQFRSFKDYRLVIKNGKVGAVRAEIVIERGAQFNEDMMTLKMILEHKFGIELRKAPVPGEEWYVFSGAGKDYSMLRLCKNGRVLMIELKIDGGRFNQEANARKSEKEKHIREREAEIQKEKEKYDGIDAL